MTPTYVAPFAHAMNYDVLPEVQDVSITVLPGPTALNFPGAVDGLDIPAYDLELARAALAESPWPEGGFELDYVYVTDFPREEIPGLAVTRRLSRNWYYHEHGTDAMGLIWSPVVLTPSLDPTSSISTPCQRILTQMPISTTNITLINGAALTLAASTQNEDVDALLDEARATGDEATTAGLICPSARVDYS